jgi:transposase
MQKMPGRLVFVDETSVKTNMTPLRGRSRRGKRLQADAPFGKWHTQTFIAGLRCDAITAPFVVDGAMDGDKFDAYVRTQLAPTLEPGDVVIWDNLKPHQDAQVRQAVERAGATIEPLPPWSPELTPIEKMFSKVKEVLRSVGARTVDAVYDAMGRALRAVRVSDIVGWFESCGVRVGARVARVTRSRAADRVCAGHGGAPGHEGKHPPPWAHDQGWFPSRGLCATQG